MRHHHRDVLIAGAGPVGLFPACELKSAGCSVSVPDREPEPGGAFKRLPFGTRGLTVATTETLDRRGLLDPLLHRSATGDAAASTPWGRHARQSGGHFAGIPFFRDRIDHGAWPYRSGAPVGMLQTTMADIEAVLAERADALGIPIHRGRVVDRLRQDDGGVLPGTGGETHGAAWLVGCDGARSAVRALAGIDFHGTEPAFTGYSVQARPLDPAALRPGRHRTATGQYSFTPPDMISVVEFDNGAAHRSGPVARRQIEALLLGITGKAVGLEPIVLASTWTDRAFRADAYRSGRVLLAGDAAHIHSPLGGQGLDLGIGDAINLGWKLAAEIRGRAPPGLLDGYAAERQPVADAVLAWSRAQVAVMRPDATGRALAAIVGDLMETRDGATYVADRVWGTGLRYPMGGTHGLPGSSAPDLALPDGTRLNLHLRDGRGLMFDSTANSGLRARCDRTNDRVRYLAGAAPDRGLGAMLVRPDGIVCWAVDGTGRGDDIDPAMARWFDDAAPAAR